MFFNEVFSILFGGATPAQITADLFMYLLGAAVVIGFDLASRNKASERTPEKFNLVFLLKDNTNRLLLTFLIGLIVLVVGNELGAFIGVQLPTAAQRFMPLVAGLFSDAIALAIKNKVRSKK